MQEEEDSREVAVGSRSKSPTPRAQPDALTPGASGVATLSRSFQVLDVFDSLMD